MRAWSVWAHVRLVGRLRIIVDVCTLISRRVVFSGDIIEKLYEVKIHQTRKLAVDLVRFVVGSSLREDNESGWKENPNSVVSKVDRSHFGYNSEYLNERRLSSESVISPSDVRLLRRAPPEGKFTLWTHKDKRDPTRAWSNQLCTARVGRLVNFRPCRRWFSPLVSRVGPRGKIRHRQPFEWVCEVLIL